MSTSQKTPLFPKDDIYERLDPSRVWNGNWKYFLSEHQVRVIRKLKKASTIPVELEQVGSSQYKLPIHTLRFGSAKGRKVLIWARQHGDEPECTAALNTVLHELLLKSHKSDIYQTILENLEIVVVPMVNPGGVDRFTRESVVGIDLNRDAAKQVTPEGAILIELKNSFDPEFAFNLHDMNPRMNTTEGKPELVTLAYQAGPIDTSNRDNDVRLKAKTIIGKMITSVESRCKHIAKYKADYMNRAFGDSMMRWGVSCILVESGSLRDIDGGDDEVIRLHALTLMSGLFHVATSQEEPFNTDQYEALPFDAGTFHFDEALRGGTVIDVESSRTFFADIGIQKHVLDEHVTDDRQFRSCIEAVGDLSNEHSAQEYDASDSDIFPGIIAYMPSTDFGEGNPTAEEVVPFLNAGITTLATSVGPFATYEDSLQCKEELYKKSAPINMIVFERIKKLSGIINRLGASEFRGFCLEGGAMDMFLLSTILNENMEKKKDKITSLSGVHRVSIYLTSAAAPGSRYLHFCVGDEIAEQTSNISADSLRRFLNIFRFKRDQISFSCKPGSELSGNSFFRQNYFEPTDEITPEIYPHLLSNLKSEGKRHEFYNRISAETADSLGMQRSGRLHVGSLGDITILPVVEDHESKKYTAPRFVFLNGECVVNRPDDMYMPRLGRWYFSS